MPRSSSTTASSEGACTELLQPPLCCLRYAATDMLPLLGVGCRYAVVAMGGCYG